MSIDNEVNKLLEHLDSDGDFEVPMSVDSKFYIVDTSDGSDQEYEDRSALQIFGASDKDKYLTAEKKSSHSKRYSSEEKRMQLKTSRHLKKPDHVKVPSRPRNRSKDRDVLRHRPEFKPRSRFVTRRSRTRSRSPNKIHLRLIKRSGSRGRLRSRSRSRKRIIICRSRSRSRNRIKSRTRSRSRNRIKSRTRSRSRNRIKSRTRSRSRNRIKSRTRSRSRNRTKGRKKSRSRSISWQRQKRESKHRSRSKSFDKRAKREVSLSPEPVVQNTNWVPPPAPDQYAAPSVYQNEYDQNNQNNMYYAPPMPVPMPVPQPVPPPNYFSFPTFDVSTSYTEYNYTSAITPSQVNNEYQTYDSTSCPDTASVNNYTRKNQRKELVLNKCSQALETLSEPHLPNILFGDPNDYDFKPIDSLPILTSPMYTPTVKYSFTSGDNKNTVVQNITSLLDINPFILKNKELMTKDSATETDPLFCEKCSIIKTKPTSDVSTLTDFRSEMKSVYSQVNTDELATIKLFKSNNSESNSSKGKSLMHMTPAEILTASEKPHGDYSNPYNINQTLHSSRSTLNDFTSSNNFNFNRPTPNEINHRAQDNFRHDSSIEQNLMKNQRNLSNASISSKPMMKNINTKSLPLSFLLSSLCKSSNKPSDSK